MNKFHNNKSRELPEIPSDIKKNGGIYSSNDRNFLVIPEMKYSELPQPTLSKSDDPFSKISYDHLKPWLSQTSVKKSSPIISQSSHIESMTITQVDEDYPTLPQIESNNTQFSISKDYLNRVLNVKNEPSYTIQSSSKQTKGNKKASKRAEREKRLSLL